MPHRTYDYRRGLRVSVIGLLINAGLAIIKLVTGVVGHSYALVADAVESLADIFGSLVVWSGLRGSAQPAAQTHPYGHGKAAPLAALIVAFMLFGAAIGISIEAVREIRVPHHAPAWYTLVVLIGVVAVKEGLFRLVRRVARQIDSRAVLLDAWHHRSDALTSSAAAIGISVALIGGEGYEPADDWAALFASAVILFNASRLSVAPIHELMDAEAPHIGEDARRIAQTVPGVLGVEKLFARKSGMRYWVDMHIEVDPTMVVDRAHELAHDVKDAIRGKMPNVQDILIHIEPHKPDDVGDEK
ncbi:MAG: cation diffusion facilitator family transporter [Phycisphaerae bacterium]